MKTRTHLRTPSLILTSLTLLALAALNGCNTVEGLGEDIQSASVHTKTAIDDATGSETATAQSKGSVEGQGSSQTARK